MVPKHALQLFWFPGNSLKCAQTVQIMLFKILDLSVSYSIEQTDTFPKLIAR